MTIEYIGLVTLLVGFISLYRAPPFIVYAFFCSTLLGSAAAFVLDSLGGTNISPSHLLLGFLAVRLLSDPGVANAGMRQMSIGQSGFWLFLTLIYSIVGAYSLPRLFYGTTQIFPVRAANAFTIALQPAMSNVTQSIYFTADFISFILLAGYASTLTGRKVLGGAMLAGATANLVFGALDLISYFTNTTDLFLFIRNANYAMLNDTEVAGLKRIVGSFTEASSFGAATLTYFAFTSRLWLLGIWPRSTLALSLLSLCALIFSTSSTAYVGLAAILALIYIQALFEALRHPVTTQEGTFIIVAPLVLGLIALVILLNDSYSTYIYNYLDGVLFNKLNTASGRDRSALNTQAIQNFFDTFGFGVGNGSIRASSFPVAALASLGIAGVLVFGIFFATLFFSRFPKSETSDRVDGAYRQAAKMACVASLVTATTSGALIDLGLPFYAFAALCVSQQPVTVVRTAARSLRGALS
jgi:hypothetical protein